MKGTPEVRCHYLELIFHAQHQVPDRDAAGRPVEQARLLRVDPAHWQSRCRLDPSPLHKWPPCLCDGERRLMHRRPGSVLDQLERREVTEAEAHRRRRRQRIGRLRERMMAAKFETAWWPTTCWWSGWMPGSRSMSGASAGRAPMTGCSRSRHGSAGSRLREALKSVNCPDLSNRSSGQNGTEPTVSGQSAREEKEKEKRRNNRTGRTERREGRAWGEPGEGREEGRGRWKSRPPRPPRRWRRSGSGSADPRSTPWASASKAAPTRRRAGAPSTVIADALAYMDDAGWRRCGACCDQGRGHSRWLLAEPGHLPRPGRGGAAPSAGRAAGAGALVPFDRGAEGAGGGHAGRDLRLAGAAEGSASVAAGAGAGGPRRRRRTRAACS